MIVPLKNAKTYGVLHTENYFSFLGFSKKVNSDEVQKVDVYLDDKLIDTIIANKHLQKIEDIYELEGFGFEYILPNEYIGKKSTISFKNHDTQENLQNSPYELIKENHPKFNEMALLNGLLGINTDEIKDIYRPNSIGFLATKENLEDEEFVKYIEELINRFPTLQFKGFCIDLLEIENIRNKFKYIDFTTIHDIKDIIKDVEIFILNNYKVNLEVQVFDIIRMYCKNILALHSNFCIPNYKLLSIKDVEEYWKEPLHKFLNEFEKLGFEENDISEDKSYVKSYSNAIYRKFNLGKPITDLEQSAYKYYNFKIIEYTLSNKSFKEFYFNMVLGQLNILYGNNI